VLLAYGASVTLASERGERTVAYDAFHTGYRQTIAREDELVRSITLPIPPPGAAGLYRKVGTRRAQAISKVALAALIVREGEPGTPARRIAHARFGLASVAPVPLLARHLSALVEGGRADALDPAAIAAALDRDIAPIDDIRSTGAYRRRVALNLVMAAIGSG
jgi:CO/xanthine dehydrogenase FAD-binding subunit